MPGDSRRPRSGNGSQQGSGTSGGRPQNRGAPSGSGSGDQKKGGGKPKPKESTKRQAMLNTHRINPFKYDMNEVLSASSMDPAKSSAFLATVIAKASRVSTRDAKDFANTYVTNGDLTKEEFDKISKLLDRYSKYR